MFIGRTVTRVAALSLAGALALSLAACSPGAPAAEEEQGPVELRMTWWGGDSRHEVTNAAIDAFEAEHPNITVVRDFGGFDGYIDKITTQYAGKNSPDVIQLYNDVLREFSSRGQLFDLNEAVEAGNLSLEGWPQDVIDMNTIDGSLGALTFGVSTQAFIFDEVKAAELGVEVPEAGYTWDDLADYANAITAASGGSTYGVTDLSHGYQVFEVWAKQQGEEFMDADGLAFKQDTLEDFWQYWADLRASGGATTPDITTEYFGTPYDAVIAGVATSTFMFANQYAGVQASMPNTLAIERFPSEDKDPGQYLRAAMNLTVSSQSKHPQEAAMLVDFLLNSEAANEILGIDRGLPTNSNVVEAATGSVDEITAKANAIIESVREDGSSAPVPAPTGAAAVNTLFQEFAQQVQFGQKSVKDAATEFIAQAMSELG